MDGGLGIMSENTQIVDKKPQSFSEVLTTSLVEVKDALPQDFNITRFVQNSVALLNENEQLSKFAQTYGTGQIKQGLMRGSYLGLDFMSKEAYLIPYGNKLNFMVDYRGSKKLAKKYSIRPIKDIYAKVVRQGDVFEETIVAGKPTINFTPKPFNDGAIIGAFACVLYKDGGMEYDTMTLKELENTRRHSKASNSMAWKDFTGEMYKKTVLHRLCKHIEIDFENANQRQIFNDDAVLSNESEKTEVPDIDDVIEVVDGEVVDG